MACSAKTPQQNEQTISNSTQLDWLIRLFDTTLRSISDFAYVFDRHCRLRYANKPLLDLWKLNVKEAVGKNLFELNYPNELALKVNHQIEEVFRSGHGVADETAYQAPDGTAGYYEYSFSPVFTASGEVELVAGLARNITDRKRAERLVGAQRKSLELLASGKELGQILKYLVQFVEDESEHRAIASILLLDQEGRLRIGAAPSFPDDYNQAIDGFLARDDLGTCSVAVATGKTIITPDFERDPNWAGIKHLPLGLGLKAAWSQPIFARDGRILGTFGTYFRECRAPTVLEQQVAEILSQTAALAIERSLADDERDRLLASEISAREEASEANQAKERFVAVVSHELRMPLSPVMAAITAIERDPALPAKFKDDLAMMRRSINVELRLVDDLLDVSRATNGKLRLQRTATHLHQVLRDAIRMSTLGLPTPVSIREEFRASNDLLSGDPSRLQQVFWNLICNALKFTPQIDGEVIARTYTDANKERLIVEIEDNGVGIPIEVLPRIFDAFEQGDSRISDHFGGLGLGLAIAKTVVEMHGGSICAESRGIGLGAKFTVRLPAAKDEPALELPTSAVLPKEPSRASGSKILLVEDDQNTARMMARLLQQSGHKVKSAQSAASAMKLANIEAFDLVVTDIGLPDATGYELMDELRVEYGLRGIALSGHAMPDDIRRSRDAGFLEHVVKPVNIDHLEAAIDRAIRSSPGFS